jgi:hypothetical protein
MKLDHGIMKSHPNYRHPKKKTRKEVKPVLKIGAADKAKLAKIFRKIDEHEKAAVRLVVETARAYYDAGNILMKIIRDSKHAADVCTLRMLSKASGVKEHRITLALKIFKGFENNPDALKGITLRDALKLIAPPPASGEEGYNRIDLGGDPGQREFDFGELFNLPPAANRSLKNYRTVGDLINEIIIVRRTDGDHLTSKRFVRFFEDIPQKPALRAAFKTMSQKTQAAIEDYLADLEQEENQ